MCPYIVTGGITSADSFRPFTGWRLFMIFINLKEEKTLYQKVDTNLNFVEREKKVEEFWK